MSTRLKILAGVLVGILALLIYMESTEKDDINWYPSYAQKDKIPFGTHVLYTALKESRAQNHFKEINQPPFEFLADSSMQKGTYFFLNNYISFDESESLSLLKWVSQGNTLYIGASGIGKTILDTLNLDTDVRYSLNNFERKPLVELNNPKFKKQYPYYMDIEVTGTSYFSEIDTLNTTLLGEYGFTQSGDTLRLDEPKVHFVQQPFGNGRIIIHLMPELFTNYFMLRANNYAYTEHALQYLPPMETIFWDNHYKNGKTIYTSPLYIFFKNRYLKWAYYILLIGVLLWVLFEGKRKQRAIPIIKPLPNQTLTFTKTIAGMYFEKADHKSIAKHQINHFLDYIRSEYNMTTAERNLSFIERLASKTDNTVNDVKRLIDYITAIEQRSSITKEELLKLNTLIEAFKVK